MARDLSTATVREVAPPIYASVRKFMSCVTQNVTTVSLIKLNNFYALTIAIQKWDHKAYNLF